MQESAKEMQDLSEKMNTMMQNNKQKENEEDISQLKQILDNILTLSFKQEDLMKHFRKVIPSDPAYIASFNEQVKLVDDFSIIRDSLGTLAKRQPKINTPINEEIVEIEKDFKKIKSGFDSRNTFIVNNSQQLVMTSLNNLALFLSEILQNVQNSPKSQSPNNSPSSKQCKNPRKGQGSSLSEMKSQQQSMKKQLQQMLNQMKQAGNSKQLGKELSQMLSQQEKYEQMLNELIKNGNLSPEATQKLNEIKQLLDQNQKDIVNKRINPQTLNRQNDILTRLLEAENAEKQRGTEEKRES
jgi:signal transduction histidine kinase